jgi:hypothetical protein
MPHTRSRISADRLCQRILRRSTSRDFQPPGQTPRHHRK